MSEPATGTFLVVEDEEAPARRYLLPIIRPFGDVVLATDFEQAKTLIQQATAAWTGMLFDRCLPGGSGFDLLELARTKWPLVPALVMTGYKDDASANRAFDLRADYVVKPWSAQRIRRFVSDAASRQERTDLERRIERIVDVWAHTFMLSDAESDILRRSVFSESRAEIAAARGVSEETVHKQITTLLLKVRCKSLHVAVVRILQEAARS